MSFSSVTVISEGTGLNFLNRGREREREGGGGREGADHFEKMVGWAIGCHRLICWFSQIHAPLYTLIRSKLVVGGREGQWEWLMVVQYRAVWCQMLKFTC